MINDKIFQLAQQQLFNAPFNGKGNEFELKISQDFEETMNWVIDETAIQIIRK